MPISRNYSLLTIKTLYGAAGGRCSKCKCNLILNNDSAEDNTQIGEIAHIVAFNNNDPRSNPHFPKDKLNSYENLILLCPNCHNEIDKQSNNYPIETLLLIKKNHEKWVSDQLDIAVSTLTSAELDIAIRNISSNKYYSTSDIDNFDYITI